MLIDCESCQAYPAACEDCVVTVLLGPIGGSARHEVEIDDTEQRALNALAEGGLVPPLRLVPVHSSKEAS